MQAAERREQSRERPYRSPWWYRVGQGLSVAALTLVMGWGQSLAIAISVLIVVVLNFALSLACEQATGIPTRRLGSAARTLVNVAAAAVVLGIAFGAQAIVSATDAVWVAWLAALVVGAGTIAFGRVDDGLVEGWLVERESELERAFEAGPQPESPS